ncbi:MAG: hypothetical protein K6E12_05145 [Saccharofermentans sp.]|nr:hypothetical protein [Saccharofermentans sp.]
MSKFSREEQANIVGMAAELEAAIIIENEELSRLKAQRFKRQPDAPKIGSVPEPKYVKHIPPKPKAKSFPDWLSEKAKIPKALVWLIVMMAQFAVLLAFWLSIVTTFQEYKAVNIVVNIVFGIFALISAGIAAFALFTFLTQKKKYNIYYSDVKNSEEYKNECIAASQATEQKNQEIKANYEAQCQAVQKEYDDAMDNYNNVVVPNYKNELAVWQGKQDEMIAFVQKDLSENTEALDTLYTTTQLIPSSYRNIERLAWIYEDMSTSEHDIERAIDLLNNKEIKEELVNIQVHVDDMRRDLRDGFVGIYSAIQEGNDIQSDMLSNLDGIRRSARTGNFLNVVGLFQNHKRNKTLSSINSKIKE